MDRSKILPLRPLELRSRPFNRRAIAWSGDAELAVAADDSVTVFLPDFPLLDPNHDLTPDDEDDDAAQDDGDAGSQWPSHETGDENGLSILPLGLRSGADGGDNNYDDEMVSSGDDDDGDGDDDDDDDDDDILARGLRGELDRDGADVGFPGEAPVDKRQQFGQLRRQLLISHPALSPDLNAHIWEAAGRSRPVIPSNLPAGQGDGTSLIKEAMQKNGADDEDPGSEESDDEDQGYEEHDDEEEADDEDDDDEQQQQRRRQRQQRRPRNGAAAGLPAEAIPHPGAGTSTVGGAGSSMNHVVALEWSPPGLGRNLRPVLAVLTGVGSLAVYGDGAHLPFGSADKPWRVLGRGAGAARNLEGWLALWAVGENFVVPGQEEYGYGEFVRAFAWCREVGPGRALLAYMNDLRELVVLSVGTCFRTTENGLDEAVWRVQEVLRMETAGPHGQPDPYDPDFVPGGSSFCLRWSPWLKGEETWSCLVSYMDSNYVGFKKISVNAPSWIPTETPIVTSVSQDWHGQCHHLAADAFLEFENMVWDLGGSKTCRGIIATPLRLEPFEVDLGGNKPSKPRPAHSTEKCKTSLPTASHTNPITGLVVHPTGLDVTSPPATPLYTAVRLSATATNGGWWESNLPRRRTPAGHEEPPQWVAQIEAKIHTRMTVAMAGRIADEDDDDDDDDDECECDDDSHDGEDGPGRPGRDSDSEHSGGGGGGGKGEHGRAAGEDEDGSHADFDPWAEEGPEVFPWRMRLWGLAASPGGGSSAVLATPQLATRPGRADWGAHRSQVLFGSRRRRKGGQEAPGEGPQPQPQADADPDAMNIDPMLGGGAAAEEEEEEEEECTVDVEGLSVEARLWEWMYGGGPGVPGITPPRGGGPGGGANAKKSSNPRRAAQLARDAEAQARRDRVASLVRPLLLRDDGLCVVCADGETTLSPLPLVPRRQDDGAYSEGDEGTGGEEHGHGDEDGDAPPRRHVDCECAFGHQFALCGVSGLPITQAGVSRSCGACHARCMRADVLAGRWLEPAGLRAEAEVVRRDSPVDVCPRCGGKYLD